MSHFPRFETLEAMENFYYGDINADMVKKADAFVISTTTAYHNEIYGAKVWSMINYQANAFAALPKEPWVKSGWRVETSAGNAFPSGGSAEGAASAFTAIPDALSGTNALLSAAPKTIAHAWGVTEVGALLENVDDTIPLAWFREQAGLSHARAISAYLTQDVDTPASTGMESLDRVVSSKAETALTSAATDPDIYGIDRSSATTYDGQVAAAAASATASLRDLTISLIDGVWASVTDVGGLPDLIITGRNTMKTWAGLLEAERRYPMEIQTFIPRFAGASGETPGVETGFAVATYHNSPIIPTQDYPSTQASTRTGEISPILFLDTRFLSVAMLRPTQYVESNLGADKLTSDAFGLRGMYSTIGELRGKNLKAQGKIRDLK